MTAPALAANTPPLLQLQAAGVRFGRTQALQPLSLTLHRGERLALVGANGSGKTTLLRLLHGLVPHQGRRQLLPAAPGGRPPVVAMLFQRPFLLSLSVRFNLMLGLWLHGVPAAERASRCAAALERVGLAAQARRPALALSGGQQQRLALARAWALQPDLLLLDEPTSSLDPGAKREVEALIDAFARDGITLVFSTHNLGQAKRLAHRVAYLEAGRLVVDLPVERFFTDTLPPAAAQFLKENCHGLSRRRGLAAALAAAALAAASLLPPAAAQQKSIVMASTTSTEQSGLFGHLLPAFQAATGIVVRVVAVGTGQALDIGRRGDADLVLVHDTAAEEKFVAEGFATRRLPVMANDFVLVGPAADPAKLAGKDIAAALKKLAATTAGFVSRGDKSGTHAAELRLWKAAGFDLAAARPAGYRECGCGMGPALNIGASTNAYVLTDRGTWLSFRNRGALTILVEGDKTLFNQYGVLVVNPARHPHVKAALAQQFADWLVSPAGQASIAAYRIGGEPLFFPNAGR